MFGEQTSFLHLHIHHIRKLTEQKQRYEIQFGRACTLDSWINVPPGKILKINKHTPLNKRTPLKYIHYIYYQNIKHLRLIIDNIFYDFWRKSLKLINIPPLIKRTPWKIFTKLINVALRLLGSIEYKLYIYTCTILINQRKKWT